MVNTTSIYGLCNYAKQKYFMKKQFYNLTTKKNETFITIAY